MYLLADFHQGFDPICPKMLLIMVLLCLHILQYIAVQHVCLGLTLNPHLLTNLIEANYVELCIDLFLLQASVIHCYHVLSTISLENPNWQICFPSRLI
jgi:hypothetical protein